MNPKMKMIISWHAQLKKPAFGHEWAGLKEGASIDTHGAAFPELAQNRHPVSV